MDIDKDAKQNDLTGEIFRETLFCYGEPCLVQIKFYLSDRDWCKFEKSKAWRNLEKYLLQFGSKDGLERKKAEKD